MKRGQSFLVGATLEAFIVTVGGRCAALRLTRAQRTTLLPGGHMRRLSFYVLTHGLFAIHCLGQAVPTLSILRIEAVQVVQDSGGSVPLIAGKSTVIRVYVAQPVTNDLLRVSGALRVSRGGHDVVLNSESSITPVSAVNTDLRALRERIESSLNFSLPVEAIQPGDIEVKVVQLRRTAPAPEVDLPCDNCAVKKGALKLVDRPPLNVRLIGLRYKAGTPPAAYVARMLDFELIDSWLKRVYPAGDIEVTKCILDTDEKWPFDCRTANAVVANLRTKELSYVGQGSTEGPQLNACGIAPRPAAELAKTHYYGVVFDGAGFMRGCANKIPDAVDYNAVASGPTGDPSRWQNFQWDNDGSYGDWYAGHEIGHLMGRLHPGKCGSSPDDTRYPFETGRISGADGDLVGVDVGYPPRNIPLAALPGTIWSDTMDYCDHVWQSAYTFNAISTRLESERKPSSAGPQPGGQQSTEPEITTQQLLNVIALVDLSSGTGELKFVNRISQGVITPAATTHEASIRVLNGSGQVLRELAVDVQLDVPPSELRKGIINQTFKFDPGTAEIDLLIGGSVVDKQTIGTAQPVVANVTASVVQGPLDFNLGPSAMQQPKISVQWEGSDPDRDKLFYDVQVSKDSGLTWTTIATALQDTRLDINPSMVGTASHLLFRVEASDGLQTATSSPTQLMIGTSNQEVRTHVTWSIYHEGCDLYYVPQGKGPLADIIRPIDELRKCFLATQAHNPGAQQLITAVSDSELQTICKDASKEIPEIFELFVNFEWVARHEKQLDAFRKLVAGSKFDQIRSIYKLAQRHNPNTVNLLSAVSNRTIRDMADSILDFDPSRQPKLQSIE